MTDLSIDALIGQTVAGRYRLDARLATGLLSAVFEATDEAPGAEPAAVLVQLRRPWDDAETTPPVELHDHHLLGEGYTLDVYVPADVATAAGETEPARFLVEQTDAGLPEANADATAPALPAPFEALRFTPALLAAAAHEALVADALEDDLPDGTLAGDAGEVDGADALDALENAGFEHDAHENTEPGGRLAVSDTALEMPLLVVDRQDG